MSGDQEMADTSIDLGMDNPDLDWGTNDPLAVQADPPETPPEAPVTDPAAVTPAEPVVPAAPVTPTVPEVVQQADVGHAFAAQRADLQAKHTAELALAQQQAYLQGLNAQTQAQQQQKPQEQAPDPFVEPDAYADYVQRSAEARVTAATQRMQGEMRQMLANQSLEMAKATVGETEWQSLWAAADAFATKYPGVGNDIRNSTNPGLAILEAGRQWLATQGKASGPAEITDEIRQKVLAEEAAKAAANGKPPPINVPRGVGVTPSGAGSDDLAPPVAQWEQLARTNPAKWAQVRDEMYKNLPGGVL